jgi:TfoX/Sxy family transcriptional regulator of competence genes
MIYRPLRYEQMMKAAEDYDVRARRMFNGMGIYTGQRMFAFLQEDEIGLKLPPKDLEQALNMPGAKKVITSPDSEPMKEYVSLPKEILDDFEIFCDWVAKSAQYARGTCPN